MSPASCPSRRPVEDRRALTADQLCVLRAVARLQGATLQQLELDVGMSPQRLQQSLRSLADGGRVEQAWRSVDRAEGTTVVHEITWRGMAILSRHPIAARFSAQRGA